MSNEVITRPARIEELEELTRLSFLSKASWGYPDSWLQAWAKELTVTEEMIAHWIAIVLEIEGQIVGFWGRSPIESEYTSPGFFFIVPEHGGKGYGRILVEAMKKEAIKRSLRYCTLEADVNALPFYLKVGRKKIGEQPSLLIPGRICPIIRFDWYE